jgi:molecular chaperone GrpE
MSGTQGYDTRGPAAPNGAAPPDEPAGQPPATKAVPPATKAVPPAGQAAPPAEVPQDPVLAELEDRWRRAVAEADNVRKRYERQAAEQRRSERAKVAAEWLPVLDNLELALGHAAADPQAILAGVQAVREQALGVLSRLGFTRIEDIGARFDPARHEAAQVVDVPGAEPGTIVAVLRPGYIAPDGLLRPAVVAVARKQD